MSTPTPETWCESASIPTVLPAGNDGKMRPVSRSALCSQGWRRLMITGLLRDLLIRHFANPIGITDDDLRRLVWREDERTGILIESIARWRGDLVEKRPAIIIKPNAMRNIRLGIQDSAGETAEGLRQFQTFWAGSHTVFCIHGSGASVEVLAAEVTNLLQGWHPVMVEYINLHQWQVTEVGEIGEVEEAKESFVVPVTVGWVFNHMWVTGPETPKLRKTLLSVLLDGALISETR
jgi:hypothetical protein